MSTPIQDAKNTNTLAQTFNVTFAGTPTEGNYIFTWIFHDETSPDIAAVTSSGWVRMGTFGATLNSVDYRISLWAKIAGSSEATVVAIDLGEINRRAHGYVVEFSDVPLEAFPAEDSAAFVTGENGVSPTTSNQVDDSIGVADVQFALAMVGLDGTSATPPTWASEITGHENWSNNLRGSGVGFADGPATIQPTSTWGTSRHNMQVVFLLGEAPSPLVLKALSSFQITRV